MKTNKITIIILISLLLSSCLTEIEFKSNATDPLLVVNSYITPDSTVKVDIAITHLIPGVETDQEWLDDATVVLSVDGKVAETLVFAEATIDSSLIEQYGTYYYNEYILPNLHGSYFSKETTIEEDKTYELTISHPDYETATCQTIIPAAAKISGLNIDITNENNSYSNYTSLNYTVTFSDDAIEENYYRIYYEYTIGYASEYYDSLGNIDTIIFVDNYRKTTYIDSDDPLLNPDEDADDILFGSPSNRYNLFTDDIINGEEYDLTFYNNLYTDLERTTSFPGYKGEFIKVKVHLLTLNRDAYLYMKSSNVQSWYKDNIFSEPVQVYTNIDNGVGIFSGYSVSTATYELGEYPMDEVTYYEY